MIATPRFELRADKEGYIKIRLFYHTREPRHMRSRVLATEFDAGPPYVEDVSILVPCTHAFNRLSAFDSIFRALQLNGAVAMTDQLKDFEIRDENTFTLAWCEIDVDA